MSSARSDFDAARDPNISLEYLPIARELCDRWRRAAIFDGSPDQELRWEDPNHPFESWWALELLRLVERAGLQR